MAFPRQLDQDKNRNSANKTINRKVEQKLIKHKRMINNKSPQRTASVRENIFLLLLWIYQTDPLFLSSVSKNWKSR